jgi:hypothetical protein
MENLNLGELSGYSDMDSDENFDKKYHPGKDFMICCDSISNKSTDIWKTGLELYDDDQTFFSSSSSSVNHQYQVFAIIGDNSEEFDDNDNLVINPANITRGANHMAEENTANSVANRAKTRLTVAEWETIKAAVNNGASIPIDARREVLLGYHYALHRQSKQIEREKSESVKGENQ